MNAVDICLPNQLRLVQHLAVPPMAPPWKRHHRLVIAFYQCVPLLCSRIEIPQVAKHIAVDGIMHAAVPLNFIDILPGDETYIHAVFLYGEAVLRHTLAASVTKACSDTDNSLPLQLLQTRCNTVVFRYLWATADTEK